MAMVKCKECGADLSTKAPACPKCVEPQGFNAKLFTGI